MAKRERINTPKGIFKYTHVNKPDYKAVERFNSKLMFRVTMVLDKDEPEVAAFIEKVDKLHQEAFETAKEQFKKASAKQKQAWKKKDITEPVLNDWYTDEFDENDEPTGRIEVSFKTNAEFEDKDTGKVTKKSVPFVDGRGKMIPWKKRPFVFAGTVGRVAFTTSGQFIPKDADVYLGLYLNQLQIVELAEGGGGSAFGADEDSDFDADELEEYEGNAEDDEDDDDDDGDGSLDDDDADEGEGSSDDMDDEIPF